MSDNLLKKRNFLPSKKRYPYTFKCEFLLPEPWDNEKNRERFEISIIHAFMEAFPDGVDIINRGLYFTGAIEAGHEQTLAMQDDTGKWTITGYTGGNNG